jgi:hypothetical protein
MGYCSTDAEELGFQTSERNERVFSHFRARAESNIFRVRKKTNTRHKSGVCLKRNFKN